MNTFSANFKMNLAKSLSTAYANYLYKMGNRNGDRVDAAARAEYTSRLKQFESDETITAILNTSEEKALTADYANIFKAYREGLADPNFYGHNEPKKALWME